jgi:hypothetical protein
MIQAHAMIVVPTMIDHHPMFRALPNGKIIRPTTISAIDMRLRITAFMVEARVWSEPSNF